MRFAAAPAEAPDEKSHTPYTNDCRPVLLEGLCYGLYYSTISKRLPRLHRELPTRVRRVPSGGFPGTNFKKLPVNPLNLAAGRGAQSVRVRDFIYSSALFPHMTLQRPFLIAAFSCTEISRAG